MEWALSAPDLAAQLAAVMSARDAPASTSSTAAATAVAADAAAATAAAAVRTSETADSEGATAAAEEVSEPLRALRQAVLQGTTDNIHVSAPPAPEDVFGGDDDGGDGEEEEAGSGGGGGEEEEQLPASELAAALGVPERVILAGASGAAAALYGTLELTEALAEYYTFQGTTGRLLSSRFAKLAFVGTAGARDTISHEREYADAFEPVRAMRAACSAALMALQPRGTTYTDALVWVLEMGGAKYSVAVASTDTIARVKQKVADVRGTPPDQQRLIYAGKQLEDGKTLADYGVCAGETLRLLLRLLGD